MLTKEIKGYLISAKFMQINIPQLYATLGPVQWNSFAVFFSHTFHNTMTNILLHVALIQTSDYSVEL